jgi:hypothetical protein
LDDVPVFDDLPIYEPPDVDDRGTGPIFRSAHVVVHDDEWL